MPSHLNDQTVVGWGSELQASEGDELMRGEGLPVVEGRTQSTGGDGWGSQLSYS